MSGMFEPKTDGASRRLARTQKEEQARRKSRIIVVSVVTALAILFAGALFINSKYIRRTFTALTIEGVNFTTVDFEYFYNMEYQDYRNLISQFQGMGGALPDEGRPFSSQIYNSQTGETWADFFESLTLRRMSRMVQYYNAAKAAGFTLPDERRAEIEYEMSGYRMDAERYGFPSLDSLLQRFFGNSINEQSLRKNLEFVFTAEAYGDHVRESFVYDRAQLDAKYASNKDDFDVFSFRMLFIDIEPVDIFNFETAEEYSEAMENQDKAAYEKALELAAQITDEDSFIEIAEQYDDIAYARAESTLRFAQGERLEDHYKNWMLNPSRTEGEVEVFETEQGSYIIYFIYRDDNDYYMTGMRQILVVREAVNPGDYADGEDDPEYLFAFDFAEAEAKERAEAVWDLFTAGGSTEDALLALMEEHSDDTTEGGFYENISKFTYQTYSKYAMKVVPEIEDWLFDSSRQIGDAELVYTEAYGYHLLFFTGYGERFNSFIADDRLRSDDFTAWNDSFPDIEAVRKWAYVLIQL